MIRIGLRDARSHFGRFIMSIVAIALGVSFVVGSFCFREMLNNQVSQMMSTNADHDVYVRGSQEKKKRFVGDVDGIDEKLQRCRRRSGGYDSQGRRCFLGTRRAHAVRRGAARQAWRCGDHHGVSDARLGMGKSSPWRSAKFTTGTWPKNGDEIAFIPSPPNSRV